MYLSSTIAIGRWLYPSWPPLLPSSTGQTRRRISLPPGVQVLSLLPLVFLSSCCVQASSTTAYVLINRSALMNIEISFAIRVPAPSPRKPNTAPTSRVINTKGPKGQRLALTQTHRGGVSSAVSGSAGLPASANTSKAAHTRSGSKIWHNEAYSTRPKNYILWTRMLYFIAIFVIPWNGADARLTSALSATKTKRRILAFERHWMKQRRISMAYVYPMEIKTASILVLLIQIPTMRFVSQSLPRSQIPSTFFLPSNFRAHTIVMLVVETRRM